MKKLLIGLLFSANILFAQVVTTEPLFPTENDSIIVYLDATQPGAEELLNYTGTVYAHTGVNTNFGDWQHVIESWGNNQTQPALTRLGQNLYQLTVGYSRQFYNVTDPAEEIISLAIVFRSADATKQTSPDIFIPLYEEGVNVSITNPSEEFLFVDVNDTINVEAQSTFSDTLSLYVDNNLVAQTESNKINYELIVPEYGKKWIKAVASSSDGTVAADSFYYVAREPAVVQELPGGIVDGINYISDTSVVLSLYAPYKDFVYVIGDFTNWEVSPEYQMNVTHDKYRYWLEVDGLTPGKEYIFQYFVDGELKIADPYTDKISDPWNDKWISDATYPDLIEYPAGKTSEIASVLQTAQEPYNWQTTDFERPKKTDLVIYELLIRDFLAAHDYKTLSDTLFYLKNLGINAIELMPISEFEGNESWGYNPSFYFAPDKYYGPKNDLKRFIDTAHSMGIAVIMDIVLNHSYGQSPLVRLYWDAANNRPSSENPWYNTVSPNSTFSWGYDFNHESLATQKFVDRVNRYWLEQYKFDGFRFDFTKGFTNRPGDGSSFDQSRINILERMANKIWEYDSTAYVILEHFAQNSEELILSDYGMMIWGNLNYNYNEATMGYHDSNKSDFSWGSYKARGWNQPHLVTYMESHDEERLMFKNLEYGNSSGDYNVQSLGTALNRIKLAAAFFFTIPGPKMIWMFEELGYDVSIDDPCRVCNKPIRWNYYDDPRRLNLYKTFGALIKLKTEYDAFESDNFQLSVSASTKRIKITDESMNVVIIGNFDVIDKTINPEFHSIGTWYDYFSGDSISVTDVSEPIPLEPGEFHIYTTVKLPTPEKDILLAVEDSGNGIVKDYHLYQNYPNPFNPTTKIKYTIPAVETHRDASLQVSIKVYDILGREIATLVNEERKPGSYEVSFDAEGLASGVYLYQLKVGDFISTKKMLLLR